MKQRSVAYSGGSSTDRALARNDRDHADRAMCRLFVPTTDSPTRNVEKTHAKQREARDRAAH